MTISTARFTPSLLDGATLERLFTAREKTLADAVARIEAAVEIGQLSHTLFLGPRGAGKTHLIALVNHRAMALPGFGKSFRLAWLNEDAYFTIGGLSDLMSAIDQAVDPGEAAEGTEPPLTVVLIENFDQILTILGPTGQRQLRAQIERHRNLLLITSATRLNSELLKQAEPFYGFFRPVPLEGFSVDQAADMLKRVADLRGDRTTVVRLDEPEARARLAAIRQLAGGQPRIWALLAEGLTTRSVDDLVEAAISQFDDLTPLYQEQLARLSPTERKVVMALVEADHPMTVSDLANTSGVTRGTTANSVRDLVNKHWLRARDGYLTKFLDRRLTYYELAEPLARVYFQIKSSRGEPIRLLVEFLATWFDGEALRSELPSASSIASRYIVDASCLADEPGHIARGQLIHGFSINEKGWRKRTSRNQAFERECRVIDESLGQLQRSESAELLMRLPTSTVNLLEDQLRNHSPAFVRIKLVISAVNSSLNTVWLESVDDALPAVLPSERRTAWIAAACARMLVGQHDVAIDSLQGALSVDQDPLNATEVGLVGATIQEVAERSGNQVFVRDAALCLLPRTPDEFSFDLSAAVIRCCQRTDLDAVLAGVMERLCHEKKTSLPTLDTLTRVAAETRQAGVIEGMLLRHAIAFRLADLGSNSEAIKLLGVVLEGASLVLGPDHPNTLASRNNLARLLAETGDMARAVEQFQVLLADMLRVLGPDHPGTLVTRTNLAYFFVALGDPVRATEEFCSLLPDMLRVFGPRHRFTLAVEEFLRNPSSAEMGADSMRG